MRTYVLAYLLATCYQAFAVHQAVVRINAKGISGTITFTEVSETSVRVVADLAGLTGEQAWHVHQLPVDQTVDPEVQCMSSWVGPHYDPTNARANPNYDDDCSTTTPQNCEYGDLTGRLGRLPINGQLDAVDSTGNVALQGLYSIVGRSIVIHEPVQGRNFECGTIRLQEEIDGAEVVILESIFVSPVAGRMYLKQVAGERDVQVWGKLYYVNDSAATVNHNWHIHQTLPMQDYRVGMCASTGPHYDPLGADASSDGYDQRCSPTMPTGCEIGDLTGKLGTVNVAAVPSPYSNDAFFYTDTYLNLTGTYPVINRAIVVHYPDRAGPRLSCAPLVSAENFTLTAFRSGDGPSLASISQYSRYEDTILSLGFLPRTNVPAELGSDNPDLTIVTAVLTPNTACPLAETPASDATYTPYPVTDDVTPDGPALGDLSDSYDDAITSCNTFSAFDVPVFGTRTTISARTLRYTYGNRRECGALLPPLEGEGITRARAAFSGRMIEGNIFFVQNRTDDVVTGSTFIIVDIYYTADQPTTEQHNWHIHQEQAVEGAVCTGTIGPHYNPFGVSLDAPGINSNYSADCNGNYELRCESGDLAGKHGQLSIGAGATDNRPTYSYVDNNLELGGDYTVVGRSVGLHLPTPDGGALFDCATVTAFSLSEDTITASVTAASFSNRVEFARQVTNGITSANNVVILNQFASGDCVTITMRALGINQATADAYATMIDARVQGNFNNCAADSIEVGTCPLEAGAPIALLSVPLLLLSLLLSSLL